VGFPGRADTSVSLDRKIPELGYVEGNVVLACWAFNRMRQDFKLDVLVNCRRFLDRHEAEQCKADYTFT